MIDLLSRNLTHTRTIKEGGIRNMDDEISSEMMILESSTS